MQFEITRTTIFDLCSDSELNVIASRKQGNVVISVLLLGDLVPLSIHTSIMIGDSMFRRPSEVKTARKAMANNTIMPTPGK